MRRDPREDRMLELAADYTLGALDAEEARAFEAHLAAGCPDCRAEAEAYGVVAGKIGIGAATQAAPPDLRYRLLTDVALEAAARGGAPAGSLTIRQNEGKWSRYWEGVYIKTLYTDKARGTRSFLCRMLPGARLPRHRHTAVEECLVLEGDYQVNGQILGPGDYHINLPGSLDLDLRTEGGALVLIIGPEKYEMLEAAP